MDIVLYGLLKKRIDGVASGVSSARVEGNKLIFTFADGTSSEMIFPTPSDGVSVVNAEINSQNHLILSLSNSTTIDAGLISTLKGEDGRDGIDGVGITSIAKDSSVGNVDTYKIYFTDDTSTTFTVTNATSVDNLSQLNNDVGFITNTVNNLVNYYTKTQIYTKDEISNLLQGISAGLSVMIVSELPLDNISLTTIYLIQDETNNNSYEQWMYIAGQWASLGSTTIDLSAYYTKANVDNLLLGYVTTTSLVTTLENYVKKNELASIATSGSYNDLKDLPTIPSVEGLATTAYVDNAVGNISVDLTTDYYTKEETNTLIANLPSGETVDLSNYYTKDETYNKTEVDNLVSSSDGGEAVDLSNYYTKEEIDGLIPEVTDGVSPTIVENADNNDTTYKLDVTDVNGTFTTPNLKGDINIDPLDYVNSVEGIEDTPVGHIISHMGNTAPKHYLICDGATYNIADYPYLTQHFIDEFGSVNYFGGDGTSTFAVPDLRGEFLRGTGDNLRANQGNGAEVGIHQDATEHIAITFGGNASNEQMFFVKRGNYTDYNMNNLNADSRIVPNNGVRFIEVQGVAAGDQNVPKYITSRPTNTSVLYCIKYEPTYFIYNAVDGISETVLSNYYTKTEVDDLIPTVPTKISELENDRNYISSIPEEYVTETELNSKGYLTEHQDLSEYAKTVDVVAKEDGKDLVSDTDIAQITTNRNAIETLNGTGEGSIDQKVANEIAKVVANAPEDFDTLKEVADWIVNDTSGAAKMQNDIATLNGDETKEGSVQYQIKNALTDYATTENLNTKLDKKVNVADIVDNLTSTEVNKPVSANQAKILNEKVTALDESVANHIDNTDIHVTANDKNAWDNKIDKAAIVTTLNDTVTDEQVVGALSVKNSINNATSCASVAGSREATATDSATAPIISFKGNGYIQQNRYTGKNLLNPTLRNTSDGGITCYYNSDGTYTLTGVANKDVLFPVQLVDTTDLIGKTLKLTGVKANSNVRLVITDQQSDSSVKTAVNEEGITFQVEEWTAGVKNFSLYIGVYEGLRVYNAVIKPMLTADLDATYDDYEPYVGAAPSPSPEYPQEVKAYGEKQEDGTYLAPVKTVGKNLINSELETSISKGITCTKIGNGIYKVDGTATEDVEFSLSRIDTTYLIGKTVKITGVETGSNVLIKTTDSWNPESVIEVSETEGKRYPVREYTKGRKWITLLIRILSGSQVSNAIVKPMFTTDLDATYDDFQPYQESTALIPTVNPFYKGDYIQLNADGTGFEHRNMGYINPSSVYSVNNDSTYVPNSAVVNLGDKYCKTIIAEEIYSNYFRPGNGRNDGTFLFGNNVEGIYSNLFFYLDGYTTKEQYDTWLTSHPDCIFVYPLTYPTDTPLTKEQLLEIRKLMSFNNQTTFSTGSYNTNLEVEYYKNTDNGKVIGGVSNKVKELDNEVDILDNKVETINNHLKAAEATSVIQKIWTTNYVDEVCRSGNVVNIHVSGIVDTPVRIEPRKTVIATLPEGFRPLRRVPVILLYGNTVSSTPRITASAWINPDGTIVSTHGSGPIEMGFFGVIGSFGV